MELAENKIKCLLNIQNLNRLNVETFDEIMRIAVEYICGKSDTEALTQMYDSKPNIIKTAFADITKLFVEVTKFDLSLKKLNTLLRCTTLTNTHIDKFCEFYISHKEQIQGNLKSIGNGLPHIIDVDWQIDYCIKSSVNTSTGVVKYNVSLSSIKHGNIENIKFLCTIQQLQELIIKLKDAARHIEKLANP